ncbi:MAG: hypothetical protein O2781_00535, partial [Bacteroidetes bacterium]|nr:hypothetical protein [Bacteroidota bacterium]
ELVPVVPVCEPDEQIFSDLVQPIIEANCIGCHNESSGRLAILTSYEGVIDAVNNYSLKELVVNREMPQNSTMTASDIEIITNWIDCE